MRTPIAVIIIPILGFSFCAPAASAADENLVSSRVAGRGLNHLVTETVRSEPDGLRTNRITTLSAGLHRWDDSGPGAWVKSSPTLTRYEDAIVGTGGPIRLILATNLNSFQPIDIEYLPEPGAPASRVLFSPLVLLIYDPVSGNSLNLSTISNCTAELLSTNKVLFRSAFPGFASVVVEYAAGRVTHNLVLEKQINVPTGFSDRSRLEVASEILQGSSAITNTTHLLRREKDPAIRSQSFEPDLTCENIFIGRGWLAPGFAFSDGERPRKGIPVQKRILEVEGDRRVLIESIELNDPRVREAMEQLPAGSAQIEGNVRQASAGRQLPARRTGEQAAATQSFETRLAGVTRSGGGLLVASSEISSSPPRGFTIDWEYVPSEDGFEFEIGETYVVDGQVYVSNPVFNTTATIKSTVGSKLTISSSITGPSGSGKIVFTATGDDSVGQNYDSETTPSGRYAEYALECYYVSSYPYWANLDIRHAETGIYIYGGTHAISSSIFYECDVGVGADCDNLTLNNNDWCNVDDEWDVNVGEDFDESGSTYCQADRDADSLLDHWEFAHFGTLTQTKFGDPDLDGWFNWEEQQNGTNPNAYNSRNGLSAGSGLVVFTPLK